MKSSCISQTPIRIIFGVAERCDKGARESEKEIREGDVEDERH